MNTISFDQRDKPAIDQLRSLARRKGLRIEKSRQRIHLNNRGGFQIVAGNIVVAGADYDLDLAQANDCIKNI